MARSPSSVERQAGELQRALAAAGQQNVLDRAIAFVAPRLAIKRMAARGAMALGGGYTGGQTNRATLARWTPTAGSPTTDIIRDLPELRARSRDQMRNAPVALGALETTVSNVVGTGLALSPRIDADFLGLTPEQAQAWQEDTTRRWLAWATSPDCDLSRRLNFYGLQELVFRGVLESGDHFVLTPRAQRDGAMRLVLQLLEADRVGNPNRGNNTETLIDGIEIDPVTGESVACHVAARHPGDRPTSANTWERRTFRGASGRRNVLHLFKVLRAGQVRGVPWIAPVLEPLKQLQRFTDAELNAAVVSSIFAVFIKMDPEAFQDLYDDDAKEEIASKASSWSGEMESGKAINLLPGEDIASPPPGRPNPAFDPFVQSILRQIGVSLQLPYEVLTMHFQSSYSAARGALLMAWKFFRTRRDWLATYFCQPVYELWLAEEVAAGRIGAPGFFADPVVRAAWCGAAWNGDGPGAIDPEKEANAADKRMQIGLTTLSEEIAAYDGGDWRQKHMQQERESRARINAGLAAPVTQPAAPAGAMNTTVTPQES